MGGVYHGGGASDSASGAPSIGCLVYKMSEEGEKCRSVAPEAQYDVLGWAFFFGPQPKDIQFDVIEEETKKKIFTFK